MPEESIIHIKEWISVKTAIVGAGVAGISTAINLLKDSYTDFMLFEALGRIGGRVHTIEYGLYFETIYNNFKQTSIDCFYF